MTRNRFTKSLHYGNFQMTKNTGLDEKDITKMYVFAKQITQIAPTMLSYVIKKLKLFGINQEVFTDFCYYETSDEKVSSF